MLQLILQNENLLLKKKHNIFFTRTHFITFKVSWSCIYGSNQNISQKNIFKIISF